MMFKNDLKTVIVTRRAEQADGLVKSVSALGFKVLLFPTITLSAPPDNWQSFRSLFTDKLVRLFKPITIFTSPNAVFCSFSYAKQNNLSWQKWLSETEVLSVGKNTACYLLEKGVSNVIIPKQESSEGLLDLLSSRILNEQEVYIICGAKGRNILARRLMSIGAKVKTINVYSRDIASSDNYENVLSWKTCNLAAIIVTSVSGLLNFMRLTKPLNTYLKTISLIVPSHRVARAAQILRWEGKVIISYSAHDHDLANSLKELL